MPESVIEYIRREYLTLEQLVEETTASAEAILELIDRKCIPQRSYEVVESTHIRSFFGERETLHCSVPYYAKSQVQRIRERVEEAKTKPFAEMTHNVKASFISEYRAQITTPDVISSEIIDEAEIDLLPESEWREWLRGTYGLCTKQDIPRNIATKELSTRRIKQITREGTKTSLTRHERSSLELAVRALDEVASYFAPDERATSSRERWIHQMIEKYDLRIPVI